MHISTRLVITALQLAAVVGGIGVAAAPLLKTRKAAPVLPVIVAEPEAEVPGYQANNDLIENIFDAHALPKRGDRIFIVLDKLTGDLTSKMGVFTGFGTLPAGGTDGEVRVGNKLINLNDAVWLNYPPAAQELPFEVFCSVVGFVSEEISLQKHPEYDLPWNMSMN